MLLAIFVNATVLRIEEGPADLDRGIRPGVVT